MISAGCAGGSAGSKLPAVHQVPNKSSESARFEAFRASVEQQVRQSAPAGFDVFVGSTYLVKGAHVVVFSDHQVAMKTASTIVVRTGSHASVFARADVTEVPNSSFLTSPHGRKTSTVNPICNPDNCPDPTPTDPPAPPSGGDADGGTAYLSGSSVQADSLAATRSFPCTESVVTNNYPGGVTMSYFIFANGGGGQWSLRYYLGYPYFPARNNDTADVTTAIRLVDGSTIQDAYPTFLPADGSASVTTLNYVADIRNVRFAAITVVDHPYWGDNLIMGMATVDCGGDSAQIKGVAPLPPPTPPPYPRSWNPLGPA